MVTNYCLFEDIYRNYFCTGEYKYKAIARHGFAHEWHSNRSTFG